MRGGLILSGTLHVAALGWLFAGPFDAERPAPFEDISVDVISEAAFQAMGLPDVSPVEINAPKVLETPPVLDPQDDIAPQTSVAFAPPAQDAVPQESDVAPEVPDAPDVANVEVDTAAPEPFEAPQPLMLTQPTVRPPTPAPIPSAPALAAVPQPSATVVPDTDLAAASQTAAPPKPEPEPKPQPEPEVAPQVAAALRIPEAPTRAVRPKLRPPAQPVQTAAAAQAEQQDAIVDALAAALQDSTPTSNSAIGALTPGEREGLTLAIGRCWYVGVLSQEAREAVLVVGFSLDRNAKPVRSSLELVSATNASQSAIRQAYRVARTAVLRCGREGFNLPPDKYERWKNVELLLDLEKMP